MNSFKNLDFLCFSKSQHVFLAKQCVSSPPNRVIVSYCSINRKLGTFRANYVLFTVEESKCFVALNVNKLFYSACWTKHMANNILNRFLRFFKIVNPLVTVRKKRNCLLFKGKIAHLTPRLALRTLVITFFKRLKILFVHAKFSRTHFFRTIRVPSKFNNAIVIPTLRDESATDRNYSQIFHTCLHRNIGSCGNDEFHHV